MTSPAGLPPGVAPEPVPVRRKRGRPRDPEADGRILDAAAALILVHGFDNMTVDDVASRAHVGKATVYRRWAKKEDLAVAAMGQLYDAQMPTPDTGSIEGDLREAFARVLAFANSEQGVGLHPHLHRRVGTRPADRRALPGRQQPGRELRKDDVPARDRPRRGA